MTFCNSAFRLSCLAALCVLSGCGDSAEESTDDANKTQGGKQAISIANTADPAKVPPTKLSTRMAPALVDARKLEVYAPMGWNMGSRSSDYLVRFRAGRINSISVHGEDYTALKDVTQENQAQFVEQIRKALDEELKNPKALVLKVAPITLAGIAPEGEPANTRSFIGAHYVVRGKFEKSGKSTKRDQLFLVTVVGWRKYTVRLRTGLVHQSRPAAHAVAAGMKYYDTPKIVSAGGPKKTASFDDSSKKADEKADFDDSTKPAP